MQKMPKMLKIALKMPKMFKIVLKCPKNAQNSKNT